jgi:Big-like domain-containing protein
LSTGPVHHGLRLGWVPGLVVAALLVFTPPAHANVVTPSCVEHPTIDPVTIFLAGQQPPISPGDAFGFALRAPTGAGGLLATVSNEQYTDAGYTATAVFDRVAPSGLPILPADHILILDQLFARGIVSDIGTLQIGGCTPPPVVQVVSPADGAAGVARRTLVVAVFDRAMVASSVAGAFGLVRTADGRPIAGTVGLAFGDRVAVFAPRRPLGRLRSFTATITTAAQAQDGQALAAPKTWSFTTGRRVSAP